MRNKLTGFLIAVYLLAGCSSGGGSDGAGGIGTTKVGPFLLSANLVASKVNTGCTGGDSVQASSFGTFSITFFNIESTIQVDTGFPSGIIVESYTTSYTPQTSGAPGLASRSFGQTVVTIGPTTIDSATFLFSVVIADVQTIREYNGKTGGKRNSYIVTVRANGRDLSGERFSVSANAFVEFEGSGSCGG